MNEDRQLIGYLKDSIDRLADKFDDFLRVSAEREIRHNNLENVVHEHTTRITQLETPAQKKLQDRYPLAFKLAETVSLVAVTVIVMKLFPTVGRVLTSILG